ncbi:replication initiation protein [uncultured Spirosoma sp.]|mgnify:CR=1 FL=1|jgi:plasmid replication initiation protein|uniref:replication initiation protein n=1 Tax=uncultured Spirosoma sp. TaxID=278208 RepID=UPI002604E21E|nr:replication initiation protein [uncultured Spirosoma sp.]MBR8840588.1 replication initiation protein [Stigonema ocellatum SAG 48.90 = DSM 106950]
MSKTVEIWQDNVLTVARYEMSEAEKNLLYMVVANVRKDDPPTKMYQVSVKEMAEVTGQTELKFETYKQATRKLMTRVFETTLPNGNLLQATFVASAEYKKGTGIIEIELSQKVRPFYIDLNQRYTKIQLAAAISLNSAYAKRIYELLCMYKNMKDKTFRRDLVDLKTMLNIVEPKTGKDKYPIWTQFKRDVLDIATGEINGHTDITFTYKPIFGNRPGRGRKPVEEVEFEVFYNAKPEQEPTTPLLERLVKQFRLRPDQAAKVLEMHSIEVINRQLYDIHTKASDGKVKNLGSYTAKVFGLETTKEKGK